MAVDRVLDNTNAMHFNNDYFSLTPLSWKVTQLTQTTQINVHSTITAVRRGKESAVKIQSGEERSLL